MTGQVGCPQLDVLITANSKTSLMSLLATAIRCLLTSHLSWLSPRQEAIHTDWRRKTHDLLRRPRTEREGPRL